MSDGFVRYAAFVGKNRKEKKDHKAKSEDKDEGGAIVEKRSVF